MEMQILVLFGVFLITVFIGVPIGYSIALATLVVLAGFTNTPLAMITQNCVSGVNSFSLMAIPFFILAGNLMSTGGVAKRIVNFADTCIGWITGGLSLGGCGQKAGPKQIIEEKIKQPGPGSV